MALDHSTFENRMVFFKCLNVREWLFLDGRVVMLGTGKRAAEESNQKAGFLMMAPS
jgi:hypothetical protein